MKIGINTFPCEGGTSGVGVYITHILKRIPPSGALYELFGWEEDRFAYSEAAPDLEFIPRYPLGGSFALPLWHCFKYPQFARDRAYNACFFPAAHKQLPYTSPCPTVGVVHDMTAYGGSEKVGTALSARIRRTLPNALRRLDRVIAVSHWVKQQLIDLAKVKESHIEVVPNGIDHAAFYPRPRNEESIVLIQPFSFRRPYVLYTSRLEHPSKNHIRLIDAFGIFKERTKYPHRLVLAGGDLAGAERIKAAAAASPFRHDIFFTGHFPPKHIPELYAGADIVVIPSMYEGFGMGALEAMASGVPVACARAGSLPETAEHAALYFDPYKPEDMADRMATLTSNREVYRECRRRGLERAAAFSWDRCAERTLTILQETLGR
ncbi:MAG: glycosyltransferase family 4 protein [Spirochaetaceae bacterium]|jgi:glycosyltransferase involved in cell wall biosynthesis|nr:glycosyltransferase family 4 protein [Spirochaetaceae bacterium]